MMMGPSNAAPSKCCRNADISSLERVRLHGEEKSYYLCHFKGFVLQRMSLLLCALLTLCSMWTSCAALSCPGATSVLPSGIETDPCSPAFPPRPARAHDVKRFYKTNAGNAQRAPCATAFDSLTAPSSFGFDARTINYGFQVAQTFTVSTTQTISSATIFLWAFPGDTITAVDFTVFQDGAACATSPGSSVVASGTLSTLTVTTVIASNSYGYSILQVDLTFGTPFTVGPGSCYWLQLENAVVPSSNPIFWDSQNSNCNGGFWQSTVGFNPSGECSVNLQLCGASMVITE